MRIDLKDMHNIPIIALTTYAMLTGNGHATSLALCILWLFVLSGATGIFAFITIAALIASDSVDSLSDAAKKQAKRVKQQHAENGDFESFRMRVKVFIMVSPFLIMATAGYVILGVIGCVVSAWFLAARMSLAEAVIKAEAENPAMSERTILECRE